MSATAAAPAAAPDARRMAACLGAAVLLWVTQGLGLNLVSANTYQLQGALGATVNEATWLVAAYMAPNVSLTAILTKVRSQFGLRRFAEISIALFAVVSVLHLFVFNLHSAVAVRFVAGIAASPISTLGFLYMLEAFPPEKKLSWGLSLALTCSAATPALARLISPVLLDLDQWRGLYTLEVGLALLCLAVVWRLPLAPVPRARVLHWLDAVSYPLIALGFGLLAVVFTLGRLYWWFEAPWIGICLAVAVLALALAAAIEFNRETPLMNIRWLASGEMVRLALVLLAFRIVLSEQSSGAPGLFQALGLLNEQSRGLYLTILGASVTGGVLCGALLKPERIPALHILSLACIAAGAFMDGHATTLTRPAGMHLSQGLIAFGGALFLPAAMQTGMTHTLKQGPPFVTSFILVFLFTQSLGGLIGSALFGTFVTLREKYHSSYLVEHITLADPLVAGRVRQLAATYAGVLPDERLRSAEGLALLSQQATREANVLAYNDAFLLIAAMATLTLLVLLAASFRRWLRRTARPAAATA
ncbi:MFS transporter [Teichococcus oryzae]|uniref:MFS transporter n=1 Tax=Teichococcus oryzae TaxID=1608942 RepID=A0A5B2TEY2_9PROT|nr:MFS transporter [Pseudoroseomonas oryzae]KAA2212684.1 MFS transporter [Pseudoroseomonas oryzae]